MYQELVGNEDDDISDKPNNNNNKPTLASIENHVIVLPPDTKIEPLLEHILPGPITFSNISNTIIMAD